MDNSETKSNSPSETFAQGESLHASWKDQKNRSRGISSGINASRVGFLHEKDPASLLVLSFFSLVFAALASYLSIKFMSDGSEAVGQTIINYGEIQLTTNSGSTIITVLFGIAAFLLGIVGTLLPIWAVGRLIADAIKDGAKS